jgi:hypothetical protein
LDLRSKSLPKRSAILEMRLDFFKLDFVPVTREVVGILYLLKVGPVRSGHVVGRILVIGVVELFLLAQAIVLCYL